MSHILAKIAEGRIHFVDLNAWRRREHPELEWSGLCRSLEQLKERRNLNATRRRIRG